MQDETAAAVMHESTQPHLSEVVLRRMATAKVKVPTVHGGLRREATLLSCRSLGLSHEMGLLEWLRMVSLEAKLISIGTGRRSEW